MWSLAGITFAEIDKPGPYAGGVHLQMIETTAMVTACTFGGAHLDELFITTTREGLQAGDDPVAGSLFRATVGVSGLPVREFAG